MTTLDDPATRLRPRGAPAALRRNAQTRHRLSFLDGGVIYKIERELLGLRATGADRFGKNRVGRDHLAFWVGSLAELEAPTAHLRGCHAGG